LTELLRAEIDSDRWKWVQHTLQQELQSADLHNFAVSFAAVGRRIGTCQLASERLTSQTSAVGLEAPLSWTVDELARAVLLLAAARSRGAVELERLVQGCYQYGDSRERQAILRTLALLPDPQRFLPIAQEACRTHVQPIFEAVACENPYPSRYFPEASFNQLVLKALFLGLSLPRIWGLRERLSAELQRMANDYASERRAAGRPVPDEVYRLGVMSQVEMPRSGDP
jgi:hypothetical protein